MDSGSSSLIHHRSGFGSPAFTLVEVLVALAILSLGTFAIVSTTLSAINALNTDFENDPMLLWAEEAVFALDPEDLETGGTLTLPDEREIAYQAEIEPGPLPDLMIIAAEIELDGQTRLLRRLRYLPGEMEAADREDLLETLRPALE